MKHDLCTNPILASQLSDTDVSPEFIHRHTVYTRMPHLHIRGAPSSHGTSPSPFISSSVCIYIPPSSPQPHLLFISFTLPPYIGTHIPLYGIHVALLIIPSHHAYVSVTPLSNAVGIPYWRLWWGMGGPVLLADF